MVLSSRDRSTCQRLDRSENLSAKTPPPAFLFPIQQCQRPRPAPPAPLELLIRPGDRRRRLSREAAKPCQPDFSVHFENPRAKPQNPQSRQHVPTRANQTPIPGRRLSTQPNNPSQPDLSVFFAKPGRPRSQAQKSPRGIQVVFP